MSGTQRFRTDDRVREGRDYQRSRAEGRRLSSRWFTIELRNVADHSRLGLVVSRRVGGAVTRNRVKRVVREWFRRNRKQLPARSDVVVIARVGAAGLATQDAWNDLAALATRCPR